MTTYTAELARIASDIDALGIAANETAVAMIVARARATGVDPVLLSVLADASQPEVIRARAFGRTAIALTATGAPHPPHRDLVGAAS
jgi:hypothetical protein